MHTGHREREGKNCKKKKKYKEHPSFKIVCTNVYNAFYETQV
jgi:hypothetical protein